MNNDMFHYSEESHRASAVESSVSDVRLAGEIFGVLYRRDHSFHREESRQIRGIRWNDDQSEEPPYPTNDTCARSLMKTSSMETQANAALPGWL